MLLAGDIGGTKTNLAVYMPAQSVRTPLFEATFESGDYASLESLVQDFMKRSEYTIETASFGVAGPVVSGKARITNLPWIIEEKQLRSMLNVSTVYLLNDLEAIAIAVPSLERSDLYTLNQGHSEDGGAIAVLAPGTGLGEAFLTWTGSGYQAHATEGGHSDFAPGNSREIGLLHYLQNKIGHVSNERVCSGSGVPNIYDYLKKNSDDDEPSWLSAKLAGLDDPTPVIINTALGAEKICALCKATLEIFVSIMGAEAGNLALKVLATGGVYLGGGIPPRILDALQGGTFMDAFTNKGRLSDLLQRIPVHVILHPKTALMGAALYGLERLD
jgi:glucokinase